MREVVLQYKLYCDMKVACVARQAAVSRHGVGR